MADHTTEKAHGMIAGSHERPGGAQCRCGAEWSRWDGVCAATAPWSMLSELGRAERRAAMLRDMAPEAIQHVDDTGHSVDWNGDCDVWACLDCAWVDSNFVPTSPFGSTDGGEQR